ncbi:uncharacterized protein LOC126902884 [Daktulosphaira vitifoliae]|uniref:uncharacterized protein LOC126902884 n=1 Tax=Daktulosphaira vitifoliae TaxID=58002 RepID=UPI0021AA7E2F|nr:uncharacterized protein LOC126902884 [Daktulosphaira vitifoliae]
MKFKTYSPCQSTENHLLKFNVYLSRKSANITEIRGNDTFLIPLDNSVCIQVNFAVKGVNGGWISNAHVLKFEKGCSMLKSLLGKAWKSFITTYNMNYECPIKPGVYVSSGLDISLLYNNNFPKQFFYGEYKITVTFTKSNSSKVLGCFTSTIDFVRPWED